MDNLYVIPLKENNRNFNYEERREMIRLGTADLANVTVCEAAPMPSPRPIPHLFPQAARQGFESDRTGSPDLCPLPGPRPGRRELREHRALRPADAPLQRDDDRAAAEGGIEVVQIERKELGPSKCLAHPGLHREQQAPCRRSSVPPTTQPYIMAKFAVDALQQELDTTPKPGLVDKDNSGAHTDMDYILMERSIKSLRPYFVRLAQLGLSADKLTTADVQRGHPRLRPPYCAPPTGSSTHRGALFALGITVAAAIDGSTPTRGRRCARSVCSR